LLTHKVFNVFKFCFIVSKYHLIQQCFIFSSPLCYGKIIQTIQCTSKVSESIKLNCKQLLELLENHLNERFIHESAIASSHSEQLIENAQKKLLKYIIRVNDSQSLNHQTRIYQLYLSDKDLSSSDTPN